MKSIEIYSPIFSHIEVYDLHTTQDMCGEYITTCNIYWLFKKEQFQKITIFDDEYKIVGIHMYSDWDGDIYFSYLYTKDNVTKIALSLPINEKILFELYCILRKAEQNKEKWLNGHSFTNDDTFESVLPFKKCYNCFHSLEKDECIYCNNPNSEFFKEEIEYTPCDVYLEKKE